MRSQTCFKNLEPCPFPSEEREKTAFVFMPFNKELQEVYEKGIKKALEDLGWKCHRSDEKFDAPEIICTICKNAQEANLIFADLTGKNPNVFLEVGLAFGLGKHVVLLSQSPSDIPFDARTFRTLFYDPQELLNLKGEIHALIESIKPKPRMSKATIFESKYNETKRIKGVSNEPLVEIFIGSTNDTIEWLPKSQENFELMRAVSDVLNIESIVPRRRSFEFVGRSSDISASMDFDGFFHAVIPFRCDQGTEQYYLNRMFFDIVEVFLSVVRVMKKKEVKAGQTLRLDLHGMKGLNVHLFADRFVIRDLAYLFSREQESITYEKTFDPRQEWIYFYNLICEIYNDICIDLGVTGMNEETRRQNVRHILLQMNSLRTPYTSGGLESISMKEFFGDAKS